MSKLTIAISSVLLLVAPSAFAADGGDASDDASDGCATDDSGACCATDDSGACCATNDSGACVQPVDAGVPLACDGALCDTTNESSCEVRQASGQGVGALFVISSAALLLVTSRRMSRRRGKGQ